MKTEIVIKTVSGEKYSSEFNSFTAYKNGGSGFPMSVWLTKDVLFTYPDLRFTIISNSHFASGTTIYLDGSKIESITVINK